MYLSFLRDHGWSLPLVLLVGFFAFFSLICLYVLFDRRRRHLDRMAALPLEDAPSAAQPVPHAASQPAKDASHG